MVKLEDTKEIVVIRGFAKKLSSKERVIFYDSIVPTILEIGEMYGRTFSEEEEILGIVDYFKAKAREEKS